MSHALLHKTCLKRGPWRTIDLTNHVWVVRNPGLPFLRFSSQLDIENVFAAVCFPTNGLLSPAPSVCGTH